MAGLLLSNQDNNIYTIRQLADSKFYMKQEFDATDTHKNTINVFLITMYQNGEIDFSVYDYLLNKECRTPNLYLLPQRENATSWQTHHLFCR